ncbi:MAG: pseudouridine synthase [Lachnospiraceae bacterium]
MINKIKQEYKDKNQCGNIRLNKFLSDAGVCSRREADKLIESGRVYVDSKPAEMGMRVSNAQEIKVGKKIITGKDEMVLLAVNKPIGIVCTEEKKEKHNIIQYLKYPTRITYIGRLDKDSEGLILMTNNGDIINKMMRAGNQHEKEYVVTVQKPITEAFLQHMSKGVPILDTVTRPCEVTRIGKYTFRIILTQGLNRQIRRMCETLGYQVTKLVRTRIMNIKLGNLEKGAYRKVTDQEMNVLYELIRESSNNTIIPESRNL